MLTCIKLLFELFLVVFSQFHAARSESEVFQWRQKLQMAHWPKSDKIHFPCIGHKRHIYFLTGCVHSELTDKTLHKLYSPSNSTDHIYL